MTNLVNLQRDLLHVDPNLTLLTSFGGAGAIDGTVTANLDGNFYSSIGHMTVDVIGLTVTAGNWVGAGLTMEPTNDDVNAVYRVKGYIGSDSIDLNNVWAFCGISSNANPHAPGNVIVNNVIAFPIREGHFDEAISMMPDAVNPDRGIVFGFAVGESAAINVYGSLSVQNLSRSIKVSSAVF